jgi:transposase
MIYTVSLTELNFPGFTGDRILREDEVMGDGSRFSSDVKGQVVRLIFEQVKDNEPSWPIIVSVASEIRCTAETLRQWVRPAERDAGKREGLTTSEREELKRQQR